MQSNKEPTITASGLGRRRIGLTRIRTNFWTFQEKCPFFGSNPTCVFRVATHNRDHVSERNQSAKHAQTKITRSARKSSANAPGVMSTECTTFIYSAP